MTRRDALITAMASLVLLYPSNWALACPPAKFKVGALVELVSGVRLFVISRQYDEKERVWLYGLAIHPELKDPVATIRENELTLVKK